MVDSRTNQHPWDVWRFYLRPDGPSFLGYHKGQMWNGFAVPYFERAEALRVAASVAQSGESYTGFIFDEKTDAVVLVPHGGAATEAVTGEDIVVDGRTLHVYGIGAGGWRWDSGPALCESCDNVYLTEDFQCPQCHVSHSGLCGECGRYGYHKAECSEADSAPEKTTEKTDDQWRAEVRALGAIFQRGYQYYNGWGFELSHNGVFSYYQMGGDFSVYFTPDFNDRGVVDVHLATADGDFREEFAAFGGSHDFKDDRTAPSLFRIVKPYLDRLAGKTAKDFEGGATC